MSGLTSSDNPFVLYLMRNRMFVHQKDVNGALQSQEDATHYLMDGCRGGVVICPMSKNEEMLEAYAASIEAGFKIFMIEKRTKVFRSLADIDYKGYRALSDAEELLLFRHVQSVHKMFYPDWRPDCQETKDQFKLIVLATTTDLVPPPATRPSNPQEPAATASSVASAAAAAAERPHFKSGNHLVFTNLFLTDDEANRIHQSCVVKAKQKWPSTSQFDILDDDWNKVFDDSVIRSNGLRMVRANKVVKCSRCRGAPSKVNDCGHCNFMGKIDVGRPYDVKYVLDSSGRRCPEDEAYYKSVLSSLSKRVCIRTNKDQSTPGFKPYAGAPSCAPKSLQLDSDGKLVSVSQGFVEDTKAQSRMGEKRRLPANHPLVAVLQKVVRRFCHEYRNVEVAAVFTNERNDAYRINLAGEGSQFCGNMLGREHHNNTSYIKVEKKEEATTVEQRCYCQCKVTTGRVRGGKFGLSVFCSKYRSPKIRLSDEESDACFPTFLTKTSDVMNAALNKSVYRFDPTPNGAYNTLSRIVRTVGAKVMEELSGEPSTGVTTGSGSKGPPKGKRKRAAGDAASSSAPKPRRPQQQQQQQQQATPDRHDRSSEVDEDGSDGECPVSPSDPRVPESVLVAPVSTSGRKKPSAPRAKKPKLPVAEDAESSHLPPWTRLGTWV